MRVVKFGGTSVATAQRRAAVAAVVAGAARDEEVVVVISALAGVTDALAAAAEGNCAADDLLAWLRERHGVDLPEVAGGAVRCQIERRLRDLAALLPQRGHRVHLAAYHGILASGERLALPLVVDALRQRGLDPRAIDGCELVVTRGGGREPEIDLEATRRRLHSRFHPGVPGRVTVVPGFVARDRRGRTTTLGRGASDLSATLFGSLLGASEVVIYTDVDGVLSAPPGWVPDAASIAHLSYGEASTLAHFGARVLHPLALAPVVEAALPVCIRSTLQPLQTGTQIGETSPAAGVKGISIVEGVSQFLVRLPWCRRRPGGLLAALEERGVRPLLVTSEVAGQTLSLVVEESDVQSTASVLASFSGQGGHLEQRHGLAVVVAVGAAAEDSLQVEQAMREVLAEEGVEVRGFTRQDHAVVALVDGACGGRVVGVLHHGLIVLRRCGEDMRRKAA